MANETNRTVTISAEWFDELRSTANGEKYKMLESAYHRVLKERDELKATLVIANSTNSAQSNELCDALNEVDELKAKLKECNRLHSADNERMDAAERCIDEIDNSCKRIGHPGNGFANISELLKIIRAYREKKETK